MTARNHHAAPTLAREHLVGADIHYAARWTGLPSSASCTFGDWHGEEMSPELLDEAWRAHRRAVGAPPKVFSDVIRDSDVPDPYRQPRRRKPSVGVSVPAEYWPTY